MRRLWLIGGGAFAFISIVGMGMGFGFGVDPPDEAADTSLVSTTTKEITQSVYRITTPEVYVDVAGEVDIRVVPGQSSNLTIRRESTWAEGSREQSESWNGRWLRATFVCATKGCGASYTLAVPNGTRVLLTGRPRTLTCPRGMCDGI
ncbi:hypothetical protein [Nonomuraea sp. bgisy101]|uniref:hypothetical protein n=1 Tax=Nonomuraea sp. bgisy101 TaxID=3413784 RepID=UPI003D72FF37